MANTRPDVKNIPSDSWVNLNTLSGVPVGTSMIIQNKSTRDILLFIDTTQPANDSDDGVTLYSFPSELSIVEVDLDENTVWAKAVYGTGQVNVQEIS